MNGSVSCQSVQSQMADFSAGQLTLAQANAFEEHCATCAACRCEWESFQGTLQLLSALPQTLPGGELSDEMWDCCCHEWMLHVEKQRKSSPLNLLHRGAQWLNQQPRWAQGSWVASGVTVGGLVFFWGSTWLSPSPSPDVATASNIPAVPQTSAVLANAPLPSNGGSLRFLGRLQGEAAFSGSSASKAAISSLAVPVWPADFDEVPVTGVAGSDYRDQALPIQHFIHRASNRPLEAPTSGTTIRAYPTALPFAFERRDQGVKTSVVSAPLLHGE